MIRITVLIAIVAAALAEKPEDRRPDDVATGGPAPLDVGAGTDGDEGAEPASVLDSAAPAAVLR